MIYLVPCEYCNTNQYIKINKIVVSHIKSFQCRCDKCGNQSAPHPNKKEAIKIWNTKNHMLVNPDGAGGMWEYCGTEY